MKRRSKLTPDQQQQVALALPRALVVARKHARWYGPKLDFEGAVALWLCQQIAKFDPSRSDLKSWASWQARSACWELLRLEVPQKSRRKHFRKARFLSLDAVLEPDGQPLSALLADRAGEPDDPEDDRQLLRGLDTRTQTVVWKSIVEEVPLKVIAQILGMSESRISKLRATAISFLRQRAAPEQERLAPLPGAPA